MDSRYALVAEGLSKSFNGLKAVDDLSLRVEAGEIYGFLGPNGAGKTTTIKMLLGLAAPDAGTIRIEGRDLAREPHAIKRRIGYLPERVAFYPNLTAIQTLKFFADLKGHSNADLKALLASVGLAEFADKKVGTFSKGMVQLLGFAQATVGDPAILLLDEPTTGLDPNWARTVKDRVLEANRRGATVFFSSHILSEVQELAKRVAILNRGKLVAQDTVANLRMAVQSKPQLRLVTGAQTQAALERLKAFAGLESVRVEGPEIVVVCDAEARSKVIADLAGAGILVQNLRTVDPSLEEVFLRYTESSRGAVR